MFPEEAAKAARDVGAKKVLPMHDARFALARHAWQEPLERMLAAAKNYDYEFMTPKIGEVIRWRESQNFAPWWREV